MPFSAVSVGVVTVLALVHPVLASPRPGLGQQPHIVLAVVDDWGWRDGPAALRSGNGLITPEMDSLVASGVTLTRGYAFRYCSPTRSSILSGRLPIHVNQINLANYERGGGVHPAMTTIADKLTAAGYYCGTVGKWHAGASHSSLVPGARGFATSLGYLSGSEDHWKHTDEGPLCKDAPDKIVDMFNTTHPQLDAPAKYDGVYNGNIFTQWAIDFIQEPRTQPKFLYLAWHNCHHPMQVPAQWLTLYPGPMNETRRTYQAMVSFVDSSLANVTAALRRSGMWDDTLLVVVSDNGGPSLTDGDTSNNYPLRGGKYSLFDGGMRVNFFVAGGIVPPSVRGTSVDGLAHVVDLYATFCALAGVSSADPASDGWPRTAGSVPPVDAVNLWPLISGSNVTSPRAEVPLSIGPPGEYGCDPNNFTVVSGAFIAGRFKLIVGATCPAHWAGPNSPNGTSEGPLSWDCGEGCLYDIVTDEGEHNDLATDPAYHDVLTRMQARMAVLRAGVFQTPYDTSPMTDAECNSEAIRNIIRTGVWAPWQ